MKINRIHAVIYLIAALFIVLNMIGIYFESYIVALVPFALILCYMAFSSLDVLLLVIMFFAPISIELSYFFPKVSADLSLPTEPFLILSTGIFLLKLFTGDFVDKRIFSHPITIAIYVHIAWLVLASITSELPVVSFKYLAVRIWFIISFYFILYYVVQRRERINHIIWAYTAGMILAIAHTLTKHAYFDFSQRTSNYVSYPIFLDHTSYGAALAMIIPAFFVILKFSKPYFSLKFMQILIFSILIVGLIFSYTRAAWLSLFALIPIFLAVKFKIRFRTLLLIGLFIVALVAPMLDDIMYSMSKNDEVPSTDVSTHIKSMSNISSDDSNLERFNRWKCALRMFAERPITGWGPGTYMFLYASFQHSQDLTNISTNAHDNGNAHNEYLGLLSDAGILGSLTYIAMIIITLVVGFRVGRESLDPYVKSVSLFLLLSLITYYLHSFFNNFLDMDKIASLYWAFMAIIASFDIELHQNKTNNA